MVLQMQLGFLGLKYGIITTILDILKGLIPIVISCFMFDAPSILAGLFAVLGHIFPIYNKFKGGKGVATTAGVIIAIDPISAIFGFIIMVLISKPNSLCITCFNYCCNSRFRK